MAEQGARVLVLERTQRFRDRVRGESLHSWGAAEARALGLYNDLMASCAHEARYWVTYRGSSSRSQRDLLETTPQRAASLDFYHPHMQDVLLEGAARTGAEVWRGATVMQVNPGASPAVTVLFDGTELVLQARLIVGADGRQSSVRRHAGFAVSRDPNRLMVSGALVARVSVPEDTVHVFVAPNFGHAALLFPLGGERLRIYFTTGRRAEHRALSGGADAAEFFRYCVATGVPADWLANAQLAGPLATFEGADAWVEHPCKDGIVLVGDAAAANDPSFGCGMSLTLRDVRELRDSLAARDDWSAAAHSYAAAHHRYYHALHAITSWFREVLYGLGPEADRVREHALPQLAAGYGPDLLGLGPDSPADERARVAFLGR